MLNIPHARFHLCLALPAIDLPAASNSGTNDPFSPVFSPVSFLSLWDSLPARWTYVNRHCDDYQPLSPPPAAAVAGSTGPHSSPPAAAKDSPPAGAESKPPPLSNPPLSNAPSPASGSAAGALQRAFVWPTNFQSANIDLRQKDNVNSPTLVAVGTFDLRVVAGFRTFLVEMACLIAVATGDVGRIACDEHGEMELSLVR